MVKKFMTKEEVLNQLNKLYEEEQDLATKKEDIEYELLHLKEKYEELLEENEQLKQRIKKLEIENTAQSDAIDGLQEILTHLNLEDFE